MDRILEVFEGFPRLRNLILQRLRAKKRRRKNRRKSTIDSWDRKTNSLKVDEDEFF